MDSLAKQQKECLDDILKIKTNYKKDSEKRKTRTYVEMRLTRLEFLWSQFSNRDIEIQKVKDSNPEHPYFIKNFYEEAEKHYEALSDLLMNKLEEVMEQETQAAEEKRKLEETKAWAASKQAEAEEAARVAKAAADKATASILNREEEIVPLSTEEYSTKLYRVQIETIKLLDRLINAIKAETDQIRSAFYYQQKLNTVQEYWNKITLNHNDIVANPNELCTEYFENHIYQNTEDKFQDIVIYLQEKLGGVERSDEDIKLPRLVIPVFDGDYQNWTSFHDIFVRLIHNNTRLGEAEKMQYLKTHIRKEAASLLQHLTISDANYKTAWQLLNDRFNNKRKLFSVQLQLLLSQPKLEHESAVGIRKLHDTTKECLHSLSNLGVNTDNWAPMIAHIVIQKLDFESHKLYEQGLEKPRELPTYEVIFRFLENRFQSLESLKDSKKKESVAQFKNNRTTKNQDWARYKSYHSTAKPTKCPYCHQSHKIYSCQKFSTLTAQQRKDFIQSNKLCLNCLTHNNGERCRSRYTCSICKQPHHTLLHQDPKIQAATHVSTTEEEERTEVQSLLSKHNYNVLLATALIKTKAIDGRIECIRALIDPGSQASFVSEKTAQLLGLPRTKAHAEISGIGLAESGTVRQKITLVLQPRFSSNFAINVEALILPQLTKLLPNKKVTHSSKQDLWQNIILADPTYDTPGPIDIIIGADIYHNIILEDVKKSNGISAQKTEFGWILTGQTMDKINTTITCMVSYEDLDKTLKKFWELEDVNSSKEQLSQEDKQCEEHFKTTHIRNPDGTYTVRIPFKSTLNKLGESKRRATARLLQNEKRFASNKVLEKNYKQFMQEYKSLNHMIRVPHDQADGYYLPHQAVIKEDSSTTKLRVVFDASSKTTTGISLNDTMYTGPKLQRDLAEILLRWRKHRYVFTADIEKMYRQIKVHKSDQKYQKILWRSSIAQPIEQYCLTTVTYGTAAAPFLAIRTLQQLASDEKQRYPSASPILLTDFYVDDLMTGADTLRDAKKIQKELTDLLASGGFKLRKWTTNQQSLLDAIPDDLREKGLQEIKDGDAIKTLGVYWLPSKDCFQFKVNLSSTNQPTKRSVLSDIAKIFDPLGWLSPVVIQAKILMQELWITKLSWDAPLPPELMARWNHFKNELTSVQSIKIYRWIKYTDTNNVMEIHGFCDASEKAYAAVVYSRVENALGEIVTTMIAAKTKTAPIKKEITLPRLELCAAVLLSRLLQKTSRALDIKQVTTFAWTDSTITLAWIKGDPTRWKAFVANRVNEITSYTKSETWYHIKSEDNPADCASRGINPTQLKTHPLWWSGPKWLSLPKDQWPTKVDNNFATSQGVREHHAAFLITTKTTDLIDRFSELSRMLRVLTYCRRFLTCCQTKTKITGYLTTKELHATLMQIVQLVQKESFPHDILQLSKGKDINKSSKLYTLAPFVDNHGILRITGRLENSLLPYNEQHPIILPHSHHFTTLVLRDAHLKTLHGGNQSTHAYVLRRYWVLDGRNAIRRVIHRCTICCRYRGETAKQLMGTLPTPRVVPSKPFTHTGMDYAGPFNIRMSPGRGTKVYKGYLVVFVCLSTKAIHLEAVSDMTTVAFLAAFRRFTARRGLCSDLYSDCGTTFIGAKNELDRLFNQAIRKNHDEASRTLINDGTQWHFIPPAAPHFGGLWEAGVKSVKYHLRRIAGELNFTFEEFTTLLCQIEACLNSRPLCPLTSEPNDLAVITPGHFLTGNSILLPPEPVPAERPLQYLKKMELISKIKNDFWKVWSTEYLSRLQQRPKWAKQRSNIQEGHLVLIADENSPPARWPLGRVIKVYPGKDGLVRVVQVKTSKTTLERPITKLCKLPFEKDELPLMEDQSHTQTEQIKIKSRKRNHTIINPTNIPMRPSIEELRSSHLPRKQTKKTTLPTTISSLLLLNIILPIFAKALPITPTIAPDPFITIQEFQHNPGIYFEDLGNMHLVNDEWNTVVYYNLTTYYQQLDGFRLCLERLIGLCNKTVTYKTYCNAIVAEITHKVEEMQQNNLILHNRNGNLMARERQRRAPFEIIGTLQNSLFGILDQRYATYIEEEINKLKDNEDYLLNLAKNLTSITEVTSNVLKKTTHDIQQQFKVFNEHFTTNMEELQKGVEGIRLLQSFTAMTTYLSLIMSTYEKTQKELIDLIVDSHNGKVSPFLLTPIQLREEIKFIREHISSSLIIPGESNSEDLLHLYKIIAIKGRVTKDNIIFKIRIPLPTEGLYQLFKIYPVPTRHLSEFIYIEPSTQYLATTLHRDFFYPLTRSEIKECINTETLGMLCQQQHPVYSTHSPLNRCEMSLLNHKKFRPDMCDIKKTKPSQYWVQLEHRNNWIYVMDEETTINVVCGKNVIIRTLDQSGIVRLSEGCTIKHQSMSINAQSIITEHQKSSFLPSTNLSAILPESEVAQHSVIQAAPLSHLDTKALDDVKVTIDRKFGPKLNGHHVHHYITTYIIVIFLAAIIVWYTYQRLQPCRKQEVSPKETFEVEPVTPIPSKRLTTSRRQNDQ